MPKYIYVKNLPVKAEASDLEDFCGKHGEVSSVEVKPPKARIAMASGLESAAKALDGHVVAGTALEVVVNHEEDVSML